MAWRSEREVTRENFTRDYCSERLEAQPLRALETDHTSSTWRHPWPLVLISGRLSEKCRGTSRGALISQLGNLASELISPVQKHIPPLTASAGYGIAPNVQVLLYGRR
jgi:hypothetical protein